MPRVLLCSPSARFGEIEAWVADLAEGLKALGWDLVVALARGRFHNPEQFLTHYRPANIEFFEAPRGLREQRSLSLLSLFARLQPDVIVPVHLADALYAASEWKRRGGKARLVSGVQTAVDDGFLADLQACEPFVDLVVAVSRRMIVMLRERMRIDPQRIIHIPHGVPNPTVGPRDHDCIRHLGLIGPLDHKEKRVLDLVSLAQRVESEALTFHIVGKGPDEATLRSQLSSDVHRGAFFFHGDLSRPERYQQLYPRLDALLIFSDAEAGPAVAWEAMLHGIVPIASDYTGREEEGVIVDEKVGRVFSDIDTAARMVRQFTRRGSLSRLSRACRQSLPKEYRQSEFVRQWNEQLQDVLTREVRKDVAAELPRQVSPGPLAELQFGPLGTLRLRRLLWRRRKPRSASDEWPFAYTRRSS